MLSRKVYLIIFEALLFVAILSLFEFIFFYGLIVPKNSKNIQNNLINKITEKKNEEIEKHNIPSINQIIKKKLIPVLNEYNLENMNDSDKINLSNVINARLDNYRYSFKLIDKYSERTNQLFFCITIIVIICIFVIVLIWFIIGYGIYGYKAPWSLFTISLPLTFLFVGFGQIILALYIIPKFMLGNNNKVKQTIIELLLGIIDDNSQNKKLK